MTYFNEITWQNERKIALPVHLHDWLLHPGSFVTRLQDHGIEKPEIRVLSESWELPAPSEKSVLQLAPDENTLVREVEIYSEKKKWMFARTIFPKTTLTDAECSLANLQTKSLGSVLFRDPTLWRSDFEFARLTDDIALFHDVLATTQVTAEILWARRSLFKVKNKPLLLTEIFLPDMETL